MAITKPTVITEAWATNGDYVAPPPTPSTTLANQDTGFPPLQSTKYTLGGIPVKRDQMNGAFNLYSSILAWIQAGGTFTFESTVSTANTGYPAGQVLWCASNNSLQLSLVNSNTANFVTTPSYINDGTNWKQLINAYSNIYDNTLTVTVTTNVTLNYAKKRIRAGVDGVAVNFNAQSVTFPAGWSCCVTSGTSVPAGMDITFTDGSGGTKTFNTGSFDNTTYIITTDSNSWYIAPILNVSDFSTYSNSQHGQFYEDSVGSSSFIVPSGVYTLYITASASGGGGGGGITDSGTVTGAGGGGAGETIFNQSYAVLPGDVLSITIGARGTAGTGSGSPTAGGTGGDLTVTGSVSISLNGGGGGGVGVSGALSVSNGGNQGGVKSQRGGYGSVPFGGSGGSSSIGIGGVGRHSDGSAADDGALGGGGAGGGSAIGSPGFGGQIGGVGGAGFIRIDF